MWLPESSDGRRKSSCGYQDCKRSWDRTDIPPGRIAGMRTRFPMRVCLLAIREIPKAEPDSRRPTAHTCPTFPRAAHYSESFQLGHHSKRGKHRPWLQGRPRKLCRVGLIKRGSTFVRFRLRYDERHGPANRSLPLIARRRADRGDRGRIVHEIARCSRQSVDSRTPEVVESSMSPCGAAFRRLQAAASPLVATLGVHGRSGRASRRVATPQARVLSTSACATKPAHVSFLVSPSSLRRPQEFGE